MNAFLALFRLSFKSLLLITMNSSGRKRKRSVSGVGVFVLLIVLMLYISGMMCFSQFSQMAPLGGQDIAFIAIVLMAIIFPFVITVFTAQGLIFSTKDVDLILSLPVSSFSVLLARISALYVEVLVMCQVFLLPLIVAWFITGGGGGVGFALIVLLCGFFLSLLPTLGGLVFGFLVGFISSRFKYKNLLTVVLSLGVMVGVFFLSFNLSGGTAAIEGYDIAALRATYSGVFPPALWTYKAATGSPAYLLLIILVCTLPFLLVAWVLSLFYKRILTQFLSHRSVGTYRHRALAASGSFSALLRKEARKFFGTPAYLLNQGIGLILGVVACVAALVNRQNIAGFLGLMPVAPDILYAGLLGALMWIVGIASPASVSLSLEGKTLWILKAAPLGARGIFGAKAGLNFLLQGGAVLVCMVLLIPAFSIPLGTGMLMLLCGLLLCGNFSLFAMCTNLWFPKMDAENETAVIKQSASVLLCMLGTTVYLVVLGLGYYLFWRQGIGLLAYLGAVSLLAIGLNLVLMRYLNTKGSKILLEL